MSDARTESRPPLFYRCYLFDFDYTLVDSSEGIVGCFQKTLAAFGRAPADELAIQRTVGLPMTEAVRRILDSSDAEEIERFLQTYRAFASIHMTPGTRFFPEALSVLRTLRARGARLAIVSSKTASRIRETLVRDKAEPLFNLVVGCEDVRAMKPDPEGIRFALARFGCAPEEALYAGDSVVDAEAAVSAGVPFAGILHGVTPREALAAYPHEAIGDTLDIVPMLRRKTARGT